jgi:hypothetical protein
LQKCNGRFQIGVADQACREHGRRHFIVANVRRISAFAGELRASTASDYRKYPIYMGTFTLPTRACGCFVQYNNPVPIMCNTLMSGLFLMKLAAGRGET